MLRSVILFIGSCCNESFNGNRQGFCQKIAQVLISFVESWAVRYKLRHIIVYRRHKEIVRFFSQEWRRCQRKAAYFVAPYKPRLP